MMKTQTTQQTGSMEAADSPLNPMKNMPVLLIIVALAIAVTLVVFIDLEKIKDVSALFVTGLVIFAGILLFLKLVSEFFTKIIYGRKSDWKKDFSLDYANPDKENSEIAHQLAQSFSLGYLIYNDPDSGVEKKIFLPADSSFIIGREKHADIHVPSDFLSKSHFMIRTDKKNIYAIDLNSTNGTKINRDRIQPGVKTQINEDSDLRAGRVNFLVSVL